MKRTNIFFRIKNKAFLFFVPLITLYTPIIFLMVIIGAPLSFAQEEAKTAIQAATDVSDNSALNKLSQEQTSQNESDQNKNTQGKTLDDYLTVTIKGLSEEALYTNAFNSTSLNFIDLAEIDNEFRLRWLFMRGEEEILASLEPFGFYKATVTSQLDRSQGKWHATYTVDLGPPIAIEMVDISLTGAGNDNWLLNRIAEQSNIKEGEALNHEEYEETKSKLLESALSRGYFDAYYTQHQILVDLDHYQSTINLNMDTGERYRFGNITYTTDYFDPAFLERFTRFKKINDQTDERAYTDLRMEQFQANFNETDYFESVGITRDVNHDTKEVDLTFDLKRRKKRTLTFGAGYSTDIGAKVLGGLNWHYINSQGHMFSLDSLIAQKKKEANIRYTIPGREPWHDFFHFYSHYVFENTSNKDFTTVIVGAAQEKRRLQYRYSLGLDYRHDRYRLSSGTRMRTNYLVPTAEGEWKTLSTFRFDRTGLKINAMIRGSAFLGDAAFIQAKIGALYQLPIDKENRLILRGEIGHTFIKNEDLEKLPPGLRFYAGGDNSIRGYKTDGIGEFGYKDNIIGGKKLIVFSAEYERKLSESLSAAAFIDAGDAFNHGKPNLKYGAGAGVRWYSGMGSVKFDVAHGFNRKFGETYRFHLSIDAEF